MTNPIKLRAGAHNSPEEGACVMELASYLTNDTWTDLPKCTNTMIGRFAQQAWDSQPEVDMPQVARDYLWAPKEWEDEALAFVDSLTT